MPDEPQVLTVEWLREQVVVLLASATAQDPPDHQACAKYADLLFKMLPRAARDGQGIAPDELERARKAVLDGMQPGPKAGENASRKRE